MAPRQRYPSGSLVPDALPPELVNEGDLIIPANLLDQVCMSQARPYGPAVRVHYPLARTGAEPVSGFAESARGPFGCRGRVFTGLARHAIQWQPPESQFLKHLIALGGGGPAEVVRP